ncbi:hypothetical protein [Halalkalicoccus sp. NIPERK01]|uniref:hypothetical protein n=1 Tax=Halalkalicoccus sp. NIPERK01 TaxID=3053469 RepID=UPI00256EE427|nr:hypothetical protein [Halalkalicoccus sp. NIPERK01]MDL5361327.1 hypothetical protein [Halalkalicoccus sp. NIPERK01]
MEPEYTIVPHNRTPEIAPGDTIEIDLYLSGGGIPDENRLYLSYNKGLLDHQNTGEIRTYVKKGTDRATGEIHPVSGEEFEQSDQIAIPGTHLGFVETLFYEDVHANSTLDDVPPLVAERDHDGHSPAEIRMYTGDYSISIILNYSFEDVIKQDRQDITVHVTSWVERHRRKLEVIGLFGIIATIGILATSI